MSMPSISQLSPFFQQAQTGLSQFGQGLVDAQDQQNQVQLGNALAQGDYQGAMGYAARLRNPDLIMKLSTLIQNKQQGASFNQDISPLTGGGGTVTPGGAGAGDGSKVPTSGTGAGYGDIPRSDVATYIVNAAQQRGIDPGKALSVAKAEGLSTYTGDNNSSFGPFQLHMGGISSQYPHGGMGDDFRAQTGLDPRDPSTWKQQVDFALDKAVQNGWNAWSSQAGRPNFEGIGANAKAVGTPRAQAGAPGVQVAGPAQATTATPNIGTKLADEDRVDPVTGEPIKLVPGTDIPIAKPSTTPAAPGVITLADGTAVNPYDPDAMAKLTPAQKVEVQQKQITALGKPGAAGPGSPAPTGAAPTTPGTTVASTVPTKVTPPAAARPTTVTPTTPVTPSGLPTNVGQPIRGPLMGVPAPGQPGPLPNAPRPPGSLPSGTLVQGAAGQGAQPGGGGGLGGLLGGILGVPGRVLSGLGGLLQGQGGAGFASGGGMPGAPGPQPGAVPAALPPAPGGGVGAPPPVVPPGAAPPAATPTTPAAPIAVASAANPDPAVTINGKSWTRASADAAPDSDKSAPKVADVAKAQGITGVEDDDEADDVTKNLASGKYTYGGQGAAASPDASKIATTASQNAAASGMSPQDRYNYALKMQAKYTAMGATGYAEIFGKIAEQAQKDMEKTTTEKEYEYAVAHGYTGSFTEYQDKSHDPSVITQYQYAKKQGFTGSFTDFIALQHPSQALPLETEEQKEIGKAHAYPITQAIKEGEGAQDMIRNLNNFDAAQSVLDNGGVVTGPMSNAVLTAGQYLQGATGKPSDALDAMAAMKKLNVQLAAGATKAMTGRPTQFEFQKMLDAYPGLSNTNDGNHILISIMRQDAQRKADLANEAAQATNVQDYNKRVKQYDHDHPQINPFTGQPFIDPDTGKPPVDAHGNALLPKVSGPNDPIFKLLPKGGGPNSHFIGPDGSEQIKE
jgi:hypothetical protein